MIFQDAVARLERAFQQALPGPSAQAHLAPVPRRQWPSDFNPARIRNAAGLLLVFPAPTINLELASIDKLRMSARREPVEPRPPRSLRSPSGAEHAHIVLTVRADTLGRHGGQVSLPGGVVNPGETFEQAALREAHEEVALPPDEVRVLGALTPLDIPVSGFRLHPVVAAATTRPVLTASDGEVARILDIDIDALVAPSCIVQTMRERDGRAVIAPAFRVRDIEIWGATAMVLAEFLVLLGWSGPNAA